MTFKLLALGVVAFIVSLVITAPAHLAGRFLPPGIKASGLEGSLLRGQAGQLQVHGLDLGTVAWDVQPLALLSGRVQADVTLEHPDRRGRGVIGVGFGGVHMIDTQLTSNTQILAPYLANYGAAINGRFEANIDELQFNEAGPQAADGLLLWQDARLESPAQLSLGNVNVTLSQDGDMAVADLKNTGNELRVTGEARVQPGWKYDARLRIEPTPATPQAVRDTLPLLGQPDARGAITLTQQGTLAAIAARAP
jgi:general secretion pathway protein N